MPNLTPAELDGMQARVDGGLTLAPCEVSRLIAQARERCALRTQLADEQVKAWQQIEAEKVAAFEAGKAEGASECDALREIAGEALDMYGHHYPKCAWHQTDDDTDCDCGFDDLWKRLEGVRP